MTQAFQYIRCARARHGHAPPRPTLRPATPDARAAAFDARRGSRATPATSTAQDTFAKYRHYIWYIEILTHTVPRRRSTSSSRAAPTRDGDSGLAARVAAHRPFVMSESASVATSRHSCTSHALRPRCSSRRSRPRPIITSRLERGWSTGHLLPVAPSKIMWTAARRGEGATEDPRAGGRVVVQMGGGEEGGWCGVVRGASGARVGAGAGMASDMHGAPWKTNLHS